MDVGRHLVGTKARAMVEYLRDDDQLVGAGPPQEIFESPQNDGGRADDGRR